MGSTAQGRVRPVSLLSTEEKVPHQAQMVPHKAPTESVQRPKSHRRHWRTLVARADSIHRRRIKKSAQQTGQIVPRGSKTPPHNLRFPHPRHPPPMATIKINGRDRSQMNVRFRHQTPTNATAFREARRLDQRKPLIQMFTLPVPMEPLRRPLMQKPRNLHSSPTAV